MVWRVFLILFSVFAARAQHSAVLAVDVDHEKHVLEVGQYLVYANQTQDTVHSIVLNDWANAYAQKDGPLGRRFSEEFIRSFHYSTPEERGGTVDLRITDIQQLELDWHRPVGFPDLVEIPLPEPLFPGETATLLLSYRIRVPSNWFTGFGYTKDNRMHLRSFFLLPARFENGAFARYNNLNLDDAPNAACSISMTVNVAPGLQVYSDLENSDCLETEGKWACNFSGENRRDFTLSIGPAGSYHRFSNAKMDVWNSLEGKRTGAIQKAVVVDRVVNFVTDLLGEPQQRTLLVSQEDYERNPFYGLNQLPSFINVFSDDFIYELKFLKAFTEQYVNQHLNLDRRTNYWLYDGLQMYIMMKYIEAVHPHVKATGGLSNVGLLNGFHFINADFNEQYYYLWLLMSRKNLDQGLSVSQERLIRFNEQIATKYYAGLALNYLEKYLGDDSLLKSLREFIALSGYRSADAADFAAVLRGNATKDVSWFFSEMLKERSHIDYTFTAVDRGEEQVTVTLHNKTGSPMPVPVYLTKKGKVLQKYWIPGFVADTTLTFRREGADKIVLNLHHEAPEYNARDNYRSLKKFRFGNKPLRFAFFKDLENPEAYQVLYVPTFYYNLYDGITPGLRLYNKTLLDRPFNYDINPMYSTLTKRLTGQLSFTVLQNFRDSNLYQARFSSTLSYFHYAPDAGYTRLNPTLLLRIRPSDFRSNRKEVVMLRQIIVHREASEFVVEDTDNYSVFNARYVHLDTEITGHINYTADFQAATRFGKISGEAHYRWLFADNRMLTLRGFAGAFLYNHTTDDFFSFALDRATDYLFDYNYYGRSETTGLFSQQLIPAEGGFKSRLEVPFANQWITTFNAGFSIWNWIEVYGDVGLVKNRNRNPWLAYDTGLRLNLVPDYFELYFPVYSNNGWETSQSNYHERIRFIVTLSPNTLVSLFTRKWL